MTGEVPVLLELSPAQVCAVVRAANGAGDISVLLSGLTDIRQTFERDLPRLKDRRFSSSLIQGILVLTCFERDGGDLGNADVAAIIGMSLSTTHRYISTLLMLGLLERDAGTRRYRLAQG
jgi:Fic family protein